ncbi:hypothetical protein LIX60_21885 [Streptomyces sp. S07_1.15]|uniref:HEPN/Toprim-associated domain-containing protein n=1 Tax=Streptomyces sp. S07_1.15 TaxID=2873925 RepID=UPI001D145F23|nr:HEPN/Toprim-associated domain-containing protein [Streptomyces sp. S07_1.15]MCC3654065.1 hypothetical protein [Streptomyces sp. S07_1.15]
MSSRWHLFLEDLQIFEGRWDAPARLMTVFQEEDKYMHRNWAMMVDRDNAGLPDIDIDDPETYRNYPDIDPEDYKYESVDTSERFGYKTTVETAVTRLNLMGFTAERCRREMAACFRDLREWDGPDDAHEQIAPGSNPARNVTDDDIAEIGLQAYLKRGPAWMETKLSELEKLCLDKLEFFFEGDLDRRLLIVGLLEHQDPQATLRLDLSDLLSGGAFKRTDQISTQALQDLREETASTGPIIVLTEGKFDSRVLPRALKLVRPDIAGYFEFLDFDTTRPQGGTDKVVANLKSFAAAGVMNRVIGLFDNDTAGREAIKQIAGIALPNHYSACLLPDLEYARSYPTFGPSGEADDNINGRACSLEFYFGLNSLQGPKDVPVPVQWKAYKESVQDYQGELTNKQYVQARIDALLTAAEAGDPLDESWEPIRLIAQTLIDRAQTR